MRLFPQGSRALFIKSTFASQLRLAAFWQPPGSCHTLVSSAILRAFGTGPTSTPYGGQLTSYPSSKRTTLIQSFNFLEPPVSSHCLWNNVALLYPGIQGLLQGGLRLLFLLCQRTFFPKLTEFLPLFTLPMPIPEAGMPDLRPATLSRPASAGSAQILPLRRTLTQPLFCPHLLVMPLACLTGSLWCYDCAPPLHRAPCWVVDSPVCVHGDGKELK